jgi:hypothetical protein
MREQRLSLFRVQRNDFALAPTLQRRLVHVLVDEKVIKRAEQERPETSFVSISRRERLTTQQRRKEFLREILGIV